ncbi:MAG: hydrogenase maturation protein HypF, partial [Gaiellales bacterium]|nr:hydrogenase maturation protein HypF [Gaiellales bacterium]
MTPARTGGKRDNPRVQRRGFTVRGIVQGVGFRPFVFSLAKRHGLAGFVLNDGDGVSIEVEGRAEEIERFARALEQEAPELARIDLVRVRDLELSHQAGFTIEASARRGGSALIPADSGTCDDCLRELFDPADRRYRYPFINCTQCGPRFTIVTGVPYDRPLTTMAGFPLCPDCRREYDDSADRRFHAEPIACPVCGPALSLPIEEAAALLQEGAILAVKGLGGYHLACAADDEGAVSRLRARKHREDKPFAVMTTEPDTLGLLSEEERRLLESRGGPH